MTLLSLIIISQRFSSHVHQANALNLYCLFSKIRFYVLDNSKAVPAPLIRTNHLNRNPGCSDCEIRRVVTATFVIFAMLSKCIFVNH